ncbi:sulfurtransferase complex subunit TusB [Methylovirgula sp. HY1]|uniref:sulfurtransferase complex subunit TusB n=1 Tax=Methylovirgula sp. HY1 TaxID=2822761 RepID=UPI001C5BADF9|nr:sulfurtransferase complex subunit TusB [Methylovirgula sp. HY1]QXX73288.1 tRNA 5-methylaminomethyl-2-thiouridine synthase subunit TusB [Methylovirgula sp. HY1]
MSTLHTVNKSPFERSSLKTCLDHVMDGDAIVLLEDAVVGARKGGAFVEALSVKLASCDVFVLAPDLAARGIKDADIADGIALVDYGGFVDLAVSKARVCAWL